MALLAAETADLRDGHAGDAAFGEGLLDVVELEVPDNGFHFFHPKTPVILLMHGLAGSHSGHIVFASLVLNRRYNLLRRAG